MVVISFRIESKDGRSKKVYMKGKNPLQIFYGFWCKNWSWYPYLEMPNTVSCLLCYISKVFSRRFFQKKNFKENLKLGRYLLLTDTKNLLKVFS